MVSAKTRREIGYSKTLFLVRPQVIVENKKVFMRRGNDAFLKCEIYGDQPLENSWRFRGNNINPMANIRFSVQNSQLNNGITSTLNIVETTMEDKGEYSCIASNDYGSDHSTIYLQIQGK
jgi:Immunoglobulin I-set domain